jgi:hypothetical protein
MGATILPERQYIDIKGGSPVYRRGTAFYEKGVGLTIGRNLIIRKTGNHDYDQFVYAHETAHYYQITQSGFGEFYYQWGKSVLNFGFYGAYDQPMTNEYYADWIASQILGYHYFDFRKFTGSMP